MSSSSSSSSALSFFIIIIIASSVLTSQVVSATPDVNEQRSLRAIVPDTPPAPSGNDQQHVIPPIGAK